MRLHALITHLCSFLGLTTRRKGVLWELNITFWVLSCSAAPVRSISSVNLAEKAGVVLPPPDYLGSTSDKRMESSKGTAARTPTDKPESAGLVSNQCHSSKCSAPLTLLDLLN